MATNPARDVTKKRARDETELPQVHNHYVELSQEELEQEDFLRGEEKGLSGSLFQHRQICADSTLFTDHFRDRLPANYINDVTGNPELETKMMMQHGEGCSICLGRLSYTVIAPCGHVFCRRCIWKWLTKKGSKRECPICKQNISLLYSSPESLKKSTISSKASVILGYLHTTKEENPLAKSVVFSNFSKALKNLDRIIKADGFRTLDCFTLQTTDEIKEAIRGFSEATVLLSCMHLRERVSLLSEKGARGLLSEKGARVDHTAAPTLFSSDDKDAVTIYFLDFFKASDVELAILYLQKFGQIHRVKKIVMLIAKGTLEEEDFEREQKEEEERIQKQQEREARLAKVPKSRNWR